MNKYQRAINVLELEATKIGGEVFVRWWAEQNPESKKTVEAMDFMSRMFAGSVGDKEAVAVKDMNNIMSAMLILQKAGEEPKEDLQ